MVWAAFVVAAARRAIRGPTQRPLDPIRTLYYFLPAIDELRANPPDADYVHYLAAKLKPLVMEKEARLTPSAGQNAAVPDGR